MQPTEKKHLFVFQRPIVWITIGILACLGFLAMPRIQRFYYDWTGARKVQRATDALERGDFETALLNARGALATNAKDVEALRLMAKTAEAAGSSQALDFRRQIEAISPTDPENLIGLADGSLKAGNLDAAELALKSVPPAEQTSTRFHDVAAGIAWVRNDASAVEAHTEEASRLGPNNDGYQLKLARLRLGSKSPELRAGAIAVLDQLSENPAMRSAALRVLLHDSVNRSERDRALQIADALANAPDATIEDKLTRLSALEALRVSNGQALSAMRAVTKEELYARLAELQKEAASDPTAAAQVAAWMNGNHMALQVLDWKESFSAQVTSVPPLGVTIAESYALASNWEKLKEFMEGSSWGKLDYLRLAYLSRACERLNDAGNATTAWNKSLAIAQAESASLQRLAAEASKWGWPARTEEMLWKIADKGQCPRWAAEALWDFASRRNDTPSLYKASKLLLQADPKSLASRNNFVRLALLTEQDEDSAHSLAEALYNENAANPAIASTYALSLFRRGRPADAAAALDKLTPAQLHEPSVAFYQGLYLTAAGKPDEAEPYLQLGADAPLFPEMEPIREFLNLAFKARRSFRDGQTKEVEDAWNAAVTNAQPRLDWLELLAKTAVNWGWQERADAVLGRLSAKGHCPEWAIEHLWMASLRGGDSSEIYKAAKLILEKNPKSLPAWNNFITVALLAGKEADLPYQQAEQFHAQNPGNADAVATYSLALHLQGKDEQALALLRSLKPEDLKSARVALYQGMVLAAMGQADEAEQALRLGAPELLLPEERATLEILQSVFKWRALANSDDRTQAAAVWEKMLSAAERRPDMLRTLGRMLIQMGASEKSRQVLWKLTTTANCPRWVLDQLWADAAAKRDAAELYKVCRLLRRVEPENIAIRNDFVRLGLLTGQDADFPHREADTLFDNNPGNALVAATHALSLYQRRKVKEAVVVLEALRPEQLREPRVAYYYGVLLLATGQSGKAQEYLKIGKTESLLPEEENLLAKVTTASALNASP
jgi:predicted Zn-dependent protease